MFPGVPCSDKNCLSRSLLFVRYDFLSLHMVCEIKAHGNVCFDDVSVNWSVLGGLMCWPEFKIDSFKLQFCPCSEAAGRQDNGSLWLEGSGHLTYSVKLRNLGRWGLAQDRLEQWAGGPRKSQPSFRISRLPVRINHSGTSVTLI